MKLEARGIQENLRLAEQQEIWKGEDRFAGDLAEVLSPEALEEGVYIDFGPNKARFRQALELLRVQSHVNDGSLGLYRAIADRYRTRGDLKTALAPLRSVDLIDGLDALHSDAWRVEKREYGSSTIEMPDVAGSYLVIASYTTDEDGISTVDKGLPVVTLSARYQYEPMVESQYGGVESAAYALKAARKQAEQGGKRVGAFVHALRDDDAQLLMPSYNYGLGVGLPSVSHHMNIIDRIAAYASYTLQGDRLVLDQEEAFDDDF